MQQTHPEAMEPAYILFAIPFFFLAIGIEYAWGRFKGHSYYRLNDALTNLNIGVGSQVFSLFQKFVLLGAYTFVYEHFALWRQPQTWWSFVLCLVVFDMFYYWAHRWSHAWNFLWGAHVVHHSSEDFNLSVALRQSWFHNALAFFIFLPIPLMGFDPMIFFAAGAVITLYQFWVHTEAVDRMPAWFELVFNTPSHHRVHHGVNPEYIDKNHAAIFILWDRLFGTFQAETVRPTYGITTPLQSWNPTWANLHYYADMARAMRSMKRWRDKLYMLVARPGWFPEEMGGYQAPPPVEEHKPKYDASAPAALNGYLLAQFALITLGLVAYMTYFTEIGLGYQVLFLALMVVSTMIVGALMEQRGWVRYAELVRLLLVVVSLNAVYWTHYSHWLALFMPLSVISCLALATWYLLRLRHIPA
jgi:alkylglycerol monooxygenase